MKTRIMLVLILVLFTGTTVFAFDWDWANDAFSMSTETVNGMVTDAAGSTYIIGGFEDTTIFGTDTLICDNGKKFYIAKLDPNGDWVWAIQSEGNTAYGNDIDMDSDGNLYITGEFYSELNIGTYTLYEDRNSNVNSPYARLFVIKLDPAGNVLWTKQPKVGSWTTHYPYAKGLKVKCDANDGIYLIGEADWHIYFDEVDTLMGDFIAKIDTDGSWVWATGIEGVYDGGIADIAVSSSGYAYLTGSFKREMIFGSDTLTTTSLLQTHDMFVAKLNLNGEWEWAIQAGNDDVSEHGSAIETNSSGVCVTGHFEDSLTLGSHTIYNDVYTVNTFYVAQLDDQGNWIWVTPGKVDWSSDNSYYNGYGWAYDLAFDNIEDIYITGKCNHYIFGTDTVKSEGMEQHVFIAKMNSSGNWQWVTGVGTEPINHCEGTSITVDANNEVRIAGKYNATLNFGSVTLVKEDSGYDFFVAKLGNTVSIEDISLPDEYALSNYPNPFNPITTIRYAVPQSSRIKLSLYDINGRLVGVLFDAYHAAGTYEIKWDASHYSSGLYIYTLEYADQSISKKMILMK